MFPFISIFKYVFLPTTFVLGSSFCNDEVEGGTNENTFSNDQRLDTIPNENNLMNNDLIKDESSSKDSCLLYEWLFSLDNSEVQKSNAYVSENEILCTNPCSYNSTNEVKEDIKTQYFKLKYRHKIHTHIMDKHLFLLEDLPKNFNDIQEFLSYKK